MVKYLCSTTSSKNHPEALLKDDTKTKAVPPFISYISIFFVNSWKKLNLNSQIQGLGFKKPQWHRNTGGRVFIVAMEVAQPVLYLAIIPHQPTCAALDI